MSNLPRRGRRPDAPFCVPTLFCPTSGLLCASPEMPPFPTPSLEGRRMDAHDTFYTQFLKVNEQSDALCLRVRRAQKWLLRSTFACLGLPLASPSSSSIAMYRSLRLAPHFPITIPRLPSLTLKCRTNSDYAAGGPGISKIVSAIPSKT